MMLESARLLLRPFDPDSDSDVSAAFAMYADPAVYRYLSGVPVPDKETQRTRLRERNAFYVTLNNGSGVWAMIEKSNNALIGTALLKQLPLSSPDFVSGSATSQGFQPTTNPADLSSDFEIGWHLSPSRWGNGFATEAARTLIRYGFEDLRLPVIYAVVNPQNTPSIAVTQRLGMNSLGRTRKYYNSEVELFDLHSP
jgi:ribosomal-protein-alanine N-acetyltransferase